MGGEEYVFYKESTDRTNARIYITNTVTTDPPGDDPYELDGKTFGLAYHDDSASGGCADSGEIGRTHLEGLDMLMRADVLSNKGILVAVRTAIFRSGRLNPLKKTNTISRQR